MTFDPFNQTVAAFIALFISGVLPAAVAYVINYLFPALSGTLKNFLQGGLVLVFTAVITAIAHQIPQTWLDKTVFDALVALISLFFGWAGSLFGAYQGTALRLAHLTLKIEMASFKAQAAKIIGAFVLAIVLLGSLTPLAALAAPPDYHFALAQCSGLSLAELAQANQKFDTAYGWAHQLTTGAQWAGSYEARVNEFAATLGCQPVLKDGQLTFGAKLYVPVFKFYFGDGPSPF